MTEDQIKHMANRFLGWKLPKDFSPDGGISFKKTFNDHLPQPMENKPTGTNLFDATQAEAMVRYMLDGLPESQVSVLEDREMCECPKCGRQHWKLANLVPRCPQCGQTATYQTPDGSYWDGNAHCWRIAKAAPAFSVSQLADRWGCSR